MIEFMAIAVPAPALSSLRDRAGMLQCLTDEVSSGYQGWLTDAAQLIENVAETVDEARAALSAIPTASGEPTDV